MEEDVGVGRMHALRKKQIDWMLVCTAVLLPAENMIIYNIHSCVSPAEAMSLPIFAGTTSSRHKNANWSAKLWLWTGQKI